MKMKIGARIIKTGIAVTATMFILKTIQLEPAFFGAVSAVINIQPSIFLTLKTARDQLLSHLLAVISAIAMGYLVGANAITMGILTIFLILLYIKLDLKSSISMGIVAGVFILSSSQEQFLPHALSRTGVVFTGLFTAMLINVLLWPPRHKEQLKKKLEECNTEVLVYFCQAVQAYVNLENDEPDLNRAQREKVKRLLHEIHNLADMLKREGDVWNASIGQREWFANVEKWIDYHASLAEKADGIYDLLPGRLARRKAAGSPPISSEFRAILSVLGTGCDVIFRINAKLQQVILEGKFAEPEPISEEYWEKLTEVMSEWQATLANNNNSYHFHGLLDMAVTANEIKWASRQAKLLLMESVGRSVR